LSLKITVRSNLHLRKKRINSLQSDKVNRKIPQYNKTNDSIINVIEAKGNLFKQLTQTNIKRNVSIDLYLLIFLIFKDER